MTDIRRAVPGDAEAAAAVFTEARRGAGAAIPPAIHTSEEDRWFVREVLIAQHETWVAVDGIEIVGIMALRDDWIDQLYVAPTAQGLGIGSRFVELAKQQRPGGLQLWTFESNVPAQHFYERLGFAVKERTDGANNEERAPEIRYVSSTLPWHP